MRPSVLLRREVSGSRPWCCLKPCQEPKWSQMKLATMQPSVLVRKVVGGSKHWCFLRQCRKPKWPQVKLATLRPSVLARREVKGSRRWCCLKQCQKPKCLLANQALMTTAANGWAASGHQRCGQDDVNAQRQRSNDLLVTQPDKWWSITGFCFLLLPFFLGHTHTHTHTWLPDWTMLSHSTTPLVVLFGQELQGLVPKQWVSVTVITCYQY